MSIMDEAKQLAVEAETANVSRCAGGEAVFWMEYDRALVPGHIYSEAGRKEFYISGYCEYHFDKMFDSD